MARVVQFTGPRQVEVVEYEPEPLPPGHLRVRTRWSGISAGTELTAYRGTNPYLTHVWDPTARLFHSGDGRPAAFPVTGWGYSETGEVVEVAPDLLGKPGIPALGDLVWGIWGHRSEAVVPAAQLTNHRIPEGVDATAAAFTRVGAIALNAVLAAGVALGEVVAIFGQGVIGLLATRLTTLSGGQVIAVDALETRRDRSLQFGAVKALPPDGAAEAIHGADSAIELSGSYAALHEAIRSVMVAGRVVAAGFYQGAGTGLRLGEEFHHNRVELVCSQIGGVPPDLSGRWNTERLQHTVLELIGSNRLDVEPLITHRIPATDAAAAYALLDERPAQALQVLLEFP